MANKDLPIAPVVNYYRIPGTKSTRLNQADHVLYISDSLSGLDETSSATPEGIAVLDKLKASLQVAPMVIDSKPFIDQDFNKPVFSLKKKRELIICGAAVDSAAYEAGRFKAGAFTSKVGIGSVREKI